MRSPHDRRYRHAGGRDGRLRLHGRRPLPGLAQRPPVLRPPARTRDGAVAAAVTSSGRRRPPTGSAGTRTETTGRRLVERDDIDLVDICTPGDSHAEIAIAALEAGKHVLCEKPLANTVEEAEAMAEAAEKARRARGAVDGRLHLPAGPGDRAWPGSWSPRAGSARSGTCARSTSRTGSSTPRRRCRGGSRRRRPAPVRSATSARTSSTSPSSSPATRSPTVSGTARDLRQGAAAPRRARRAVRHGGHRARAGHGRRRRRLPGRVHRRRARRLRGDPVRHGPEERDPPRDQRSRGQPRVRLRGHERPALL